MRRANLCSRVSMCTRAILPSRPEMARYVGLHNFAKFSAARTRRKRYMETKTSVVFRYVRSLLFLLPYRKIYIRERLSLSLSVVDESIFIGWKFAPYFARLMWFDIDVKDRWIDSGIIDWGFVRDVAPPLFVCIYLENKFRFVHNAISIGNIYGNQYVVAWIIFDNSMFVHCQVRCIRWDGYLDPEEDYFWCPF